MGFVIAPSQPGMGACCGWKYTFCWGFDILELGDDVADDEGGDGDEEEIRRKLGFEEASTVMSYEEDDEIGGTATHPLMELCPDELPELPLLFKGGGGPVALVCPCN